MDFCQNFVSHNCGYGCCGGKKKSFIVHKSSLLRARVSGCSKLGGVKIAIWKSSKTNPPTPQKKGYKLCIFQPGHQKYDFHAMELAFAQYIINVQLSWQKLQQPYYIAHSTNRKCVKICWVESRVEFFNKALSFTQHIQDSKLHLKQVHKLEPHWFWNICGLHKQLHHVQENILYSVFKHLILFTSEEKTTGKNADGYYILMLCH